MSSHINNHSKCKQTELTNQKTQGVWMEYKMRPNHMPPPGDSSQLHKQKQAQSEQVEDDTLSRWKPKVGWLCLHRQNRLQAKQGNK